MRHDPTLVIWFIVLFVLFVLFACIVLAMLPRVLGWLVREIFKGLEWKGER